MPAVLTALVLSSAAAALVYLAWRREGATWAAIAGWALAFASAFAWSGALGPEIGISYAIMVFVLAAWAVVACRVEAPRSALEPAAARRLQPLGRPRAREAARHAMIFLLSVPAAGLLTMMLSVALVLFLPWSMPLKFAVAIFLYPVLWGALSAWICAQDKLARPVAVSVGLFAFSSLLLFT